VVFFYFFAAGAYVVFYFPRIYTVIYMKLYFLRHGESEANFDGLMTGQLDVLLTDTGRGQAISAGERIKEGIPIDMIIASPLVRARETARLVASVIGYDDAKVIETPLIMERFFGTLQGKKKVEMEPVTEEMIIKAGAETDEAIYERAQEALRFIKQQGGETVLVVSHTGFGRRLRAVVDGVKPDLEQGFKNADLTYLGEV
jgi:uncharacterized phosphatase